MSAVAAGNLPLLDFGVASIIAPGESVSGDLHLVADTTRGVLLAAIDGLGHGQEAASAASTAVDILRAHCNEGVIHLMQLCHYSLRGTRGAVMSLVALDVIEDTITWLGVGNIEGVLISEGSVSSVLLRPGVLGYRLPKLHAMVETISPGDLLVLYTDGIRGDFEPDLLSHATPAQIAKALAAKYQRGTDDALVLVARYRGRSEGKRP